MREEGCSGTSWGIEAPCKINLHLRVKGRRGDGFHDLESIFLALAWGDTLRFELSGEPGRCFIRVENAGRGGVMPPEDEKNLVCRAVSLFRSRTGFKPGVAAVLEKRIPLGAGFGGGSSDAASALLAMNALADTGLPEEALEEMASCLGSDVPFFLKGGAAWASGRGERLRPLPVPEDLRVVLVYPGFPSGTAEAFRLLDQARMLSPERAEAYAGFIREGDKTGLPGKTEIPREVLIQALGRSPREWPYGNDFLPVFLEAGARDAGSAYRSILKGLAEQGADFSGLSGAGSGCFGIFKDGGAAERAAKTLSRQWNYVQLTFPLAHRVDAVLK
ncbi:MAG: 4-(cytidine 5'-diphospho)-2-C-methyl-D-erythritol kinase [Treponema sp.]|nr:4-(cytidine 5'-diphospho)-2-C-methyl-D-erythritol kinase [Treponema sp.]